MVGEAATVSRSVWLHPHQKRLSPLSIFASRVHFPERIRIPPTSFSLKKITIKAAAAASSVGNTEYVEEPATNVKFQTSLTLPGCSTPLSLIGTGFREKVFAIIGVKVYAAGLFVNPNILDNLDEWRGRTAAEIESDSLLFDKIYQAPLEKSLQIILVRDIDGKTFWDALDDAVSPRIKSPNSIDKTALSKFRGIFQHRPLKKGTFIFLTWLHPSKMLVHISTEGLPSAAEERIESQNVTFSLFDVFLWAYPGFSHLKIFNF